MIDKQTRCRIIKDMKAKNTSLSSEAAEALLEIILNILYEEDIAIMRDINCR